MRRLRQIITLVCTGAAFIADAAEQPTATAKGAVNQPISANQQSLQGTWEGIMVGQEKDGKVTITITGKSFHFHRDKNFWFETTITLPAGNDPRQLYHLR